MAAPSRPPPIAILVAVTATGPLALNILMPSMPGLPAVFGTDYATVQLTLSLYLIGLAGAQLIYGPLSDRYGRRPVLLAGLGVFLLGSTTGALADSISMVIAGRVLQAVGGCAGMVLGRAIVRDLYERDRAASVIAYVTMAMVVAPMLSPLFGGFLDDWLGWRATFWFVALYGTVVVVFCFWLLGETHRTRLPFPGATGMLFSYLRLLRSPLFIGYALGISFASASFFAFLGGAPYVMIEIMGRPPSEYGLYFMMGGAGYMSGNFISGRVSTRFGVERMFTAGAVITFFGALTMLVGALAGVLTPLALFGPMMISAIGNGLSLPNGFAGAVSVDPRITGAASGLAGFLQMGLGASASFLVGYVLTDSQLPLALVMTASSALAVVAAVMIRRAHRFQPSSEHVS
jgi:DHA1 family bicyclomycin/chloramphenicol resistance-like MFS transporter